MMMMNKVLFGIDIGGTTVKCGLFTLNGELLEKSEIPTVNRITEAGFCLMWQHIYGIYWKKVPDSFRCGGCRYRCAGCGDTGRHC